MGERLPMGHDRVMFADLRQFHDALAAGGFTRRA
mgnify:CR=1 FL=1